jgi:hypothetical protein
VTRIGFVPEPSPAWIDVEKHHLRRLVHHRSGVGVDLHVDVIPPRWHNLIPTDWFMEDTQAIETRGWRARLPDATRRIAHTIVHDQLAHGARRRRTVELRQLLDVAMLRAQRDSDIDWSMLAGRFGAAGNAVVLSDYLHFGEALLGQQAPLVNTQQSTAMLSLHDAIEHRRGYRWAQFLGFAGAYAEQLRLHPISILNQANPLRWPARLRLLGDLFTRRKW